MTESLTWRRWFSWIPSYKVAALTLGLTFGAVAWLTATSGLAALLLAVAFAYRGGGARAFRILVFPAAAGMEARVTRLRNLEPGEARFISRGPFRIRAEPTTVPTATITPCANYRSL
jgi:hypothetical protein